MTLAEMRRFLIFIAKGLFFSPQNQAILNTDFGSVEKPFFISTLKFFLLLFQLMETGGPGQISQFVPLPVGLG